MTLIPFTNNKKPDMRMSEYDQAIVRLGLEKANLEKLVDSERKELAEIGRLKASAEKDIVNKKKELGKIESDISAAVESGVKKVAASSEKTQDSDLKAKEKKTVLAGLEKYLKDCEKTIAAKQATIKSLEDKIGELRDIISVSKKELQENNEAVVTAQKMLSDLFLKAKALRQEIAGMEEFAKTLQDKEQFLNRKEYDLNQYEERIKKSRKEMGNINEMKFK